MTLEYLATLPVVGDSDDPWSIPCVSEYTGYHERDYVQTPYGSFSKFEDYFAPIPEDEWAEREAECWAKRMFAYHRFEDLGSPKRSQERTNYCHGFSATAAAMLARAMQGDPFVLLSGSAVAGPTVGYRNAGAWIFDDLLTMREIGCASTVFVPEVAVGLHRFRDGWKEDAATRCVLEWHEIRPRHMGDVMTALLNGFAIANGRRWMGHAMCTMASRDGGKVLVEWNSHNDPPMQLSGTRRLLDEGYVVRVVGPR